MPNLVFEIGTEEMPAVALPGAIEQMQAGLAERLRSARLEFATVKVAATPRRLAAFVGDLASTQSDVEKEVRGPSWSVAFDSDGKPTGAALGFARKQGVPVEDLVRLETSQGTYVAAHVVEKGKPALEAVGSVIENCLRSLSFPKTMRWGVGTTRFVRPVRWILCLLEGDVVPMEFAGIKAGRTTRGHRYLSAGELSVPHADAYVDILRQAFVMLDPDERREVIVQQGNRLAAEAGGAVPWDEDLLQENTYLIEWPTCLLGRFQQRFLQLPRPVLVTAMKKHQRFFPVEGPEGGLLPYFVSVRNGGPEHLEKVRAGNEAVLAARFEDAQHFFEHDRDVPLDVMADRLERLLFQEKLGTMAQKRDRLVRLAEELAPGFGLSDDDIAAAKRAAFLCKADLTSEMVIELPALQGVMGREYALMHGEDPIVAEAIAEHYRPRNASDTPPQTTVGRLLAVADRMDTLTGYAGLGITPSGSADPFGLRRAAQGVVQVLAGESDAPPLSAMQIMAAEAYREVNELDFPIDTVLSSLKMLFDQRIEAFLEDLGIRYDLREAALEGGLVDGTVVRCAVRRAETLQSLADDASFVPTVQAAARVANILGEGVASSVPSVENAPPTYAEAVAQAAARLEDMVRAVHTDRFADPAEKALYDAACKALSPVVAAAANYDYSRVYDVLQPLRTSVDTFFDDVLVMTEDTALRENRLSLLSLVNRLYRTLADFRRVVVA